MSRPTDRCRRCGALNSPTGQRLCRNDSQEVRNARRSITRARNLILLEAATTATFRQARRDRKRP